jgi:hypothetical protein
MYSPATGLSTIFAQNFVDFAPFLLNVEEFKNEKLLLSAYFNAKFFVMLDASPETESFSPDPSKLP